MAGCTKYCGCEACGLAKLVDVSGPWGALSHTHTIDEIRNNNKILYIYGLMSVGGCVCVHHHISTGGGLVGWLVGWTGGVGGVVREDVVRLLTS